MITYKKTCLRLLFCFFFLAAVAQPKDPKVGLILSGGGAKGMAHVGVLKEIERAGVRIDYIGGTSMGAIVGGLYACGYSAAQLEELLLTTDLTDLINDNFDREAKSFQDKEDSERYAITLPVVEGKIKFPVSLSKGQNVYNFLVQLMHDQREVRDFSKLPIPFYCIATDLNNGEMVLLDHGFLPLAVNASSALPTLFSPVTVENRTLIDGGVSNNYPIEEMLKKKVDVIIGVDVQTSISKTKEATTFSDILVRLGSFQTEKIMSPKRAKTDIYIQPDIAEFTMLSFADQAAIIARGEQAGKNVFLQLESLAKKQIPNVTSPLKIPTSFQLDRLSFSQTPNYKRNYILGKIRLKPNTNYPFKKLREGMTNLAATQNFEPFRYTLNSENDQEVLAINLLESPHTTLFRAGAHYNDLMGAMVLVNLTQKHALLKNDEFSFDLALGDNLRYAIAYFIDKGQFWSIGFKATLDQFETDAPFVFDIDDTANVHEASRTKGLTQEHTFFVQTIFREEVILGLGITHQKNRFRTNLFDVENGRFFFADDADYYSTKGYLKVDTRDDAYFPRKGGFFDGNIDYVFSQKSPLDFGVFSPFIVGKAAMGVTLPLAKKWTLSLNTMGGFTIQNPNTPTFDFLLGGYGNAPLLNYQPFVGLPQQHTGADSFVKGEMIVDYEFIPNHHAALKIHAGVVSDDIFANGKSASTPNYFGTGLAYGLNTFAGPLEFMAAYGPQFDKLLYHVSIGWRF
ncbi:MAG: patatin [Bacteroidetes bacterium]|nr:patatin [Bacteroidota bacterium]